MTIDVSDTSKLAVGDTVLLIFRGETYTYLVTDIRGTTITLEPAAGS